MTIQLTRATVIAGSVQAAGTQHTLTAELEAHLIYQGIATRVGDAPDVSGPEPVYSNAAGTALRMGDYEVPISGIPCEAFGASPSASAAVNTAAIQAALDAAAVWGYTVTLALAGIYLVNKTLLISTRTTLDLGNGVELKLADGSNCHVIRNRSSQNSLNPTNSFSVSGGVASVREYGHSRQVGDQVYIAGALGNAALNGVHTITSIPDSTHWTYAASGGNPTNTSAQGIHVSDYNPHAGSNFTRASNVVTVTETGHRRNVGDHVYIANLTGDTSFNGWAEITGFTAGVSWTYNSTGSDGSPTGTAQLLGDTEITLRNIKMDCNKAGNDWDAMGSHGIFLCNIGNSVIDLEMGRNGQGRNIACFNAAHIDVPRAIAAYGLVCVQFDSACNNVHIGTARGYNMTDDVVAWGVTDAAGPFGGTASPSGMGNMDNLIVDRIDGQSPTGLFKQYAQTGYDLGSIRIGSITGTGKAVAGDGSVGTSGGSVREVIVDHIDATPAVNETQIILVGLTVGSATFRHVRDRTSGSGYLANLSADSGRVAFEHVLSDTYKTGIGILCNTGFTIGDFYLGDSDVTAGNGGHFIRLQSTAAQNKITLHKVKFTGSASVQGTLVGSNSGARPDKIVASDCTMKDGHSLFLGTGTTGTTNIHITNLTTEGTPGSIVNCATNQSGNVYLTGCHIGAITNNVLQVGGSGTWRMEEASSYAPSGQWALLTYQTPNVSLSGTDIKLDMGANAGAPPARLVPLAGDMLWNTNATGTGLYGRTAAGAWTKVF